MCVSSPVFPSGDFLANEANCGRLRENLLPQPRNMPATPTPARNSIRKKRLDRFHRKHLICVRWNICRAPYAFDDRFPLLTRKIFPEARALLVSKILHNAKVTQKVTSPTWNLKTKTREKREERCINFFRANFATCEYSCDWKSENCNVMVGSTACIHINLFGLRSKFRLLFQCFVKA